MTDQSDASPSKSGINHLKRLCLSAQGVAKRHERAKRQALGGAVPAKNPPPWLSKGAAGAWRARQKDSQTTST